MSDNNYIIVACPHCQDLILIYKSQIRCRIFRHGVYIKTNKPIKPHLSQKECNSLLSSKKILGCAKPFRLNDENKTEICEYI
jgi:hypothetical protein